MVGNRHVDRLAPDKCRYADSHTHLDRYPAAAVARMVRTARAAGVCDVLVVGIDAASSARALRLARRHRGLTAAAGLHPQSADDGFARELAAVRALLAGDDPRLRAVGEAGLDRTVAAPLALQRRAFAAQLALAVEFRRAVVVHSVGAHAEVAAMLADVAAQLPAVIIHYFTGERHELARFLALGCLISFGRLILKPGQEALRALVPLVPADRLLAETDTYPLPGRTTEPSGVVDVVQRLARLRGEDAAVTARHTRANFRRALGLATDREGLLSC
jgi:TatD DNase family protein